ncbi:hypothetical protein ACPV5U_24320 [Vibrio mediterranei]
MLDLKVQNVIIEGRNEKHALKKMRAANPSKFDYHFTHKDRLVRYSANSLGVVTPQIFAELIEKEYSDKWEDGNYRILLSTGSPDTLQIVTVKNFYVVSVKITLADDLPKIIRETERVFTDDTVISWSEARLLPEITAHTLKDTKHRLADTKKVKDKQKAFGAFVFVVVVLLGILIMPSSEPEPIEQEPLAKVKRKVRVDRYIHYKHALANKVTFDEVHESVMAMSLIPFKLPEGWGIDRIDLQNRTLIADIINNNGSTKKLKYFRQQDINRDYMVIDGQYATVQFPIMSNEWYQWTKKIGPFETVRDDFMDQMIVMGGTVQSNTKTVNEHFMMQDMKVQFTTVPVALFDLIGFATRDRPIFVEKLEVFPSQQELGLVSINLEVAIVGR